MAAVVTSRPAEADPPPARLYWREAVARYERPSLRRGLLDLATSFVPYLALTVAMYASLQVSVWLTLALAVPAAGFLLRTFIVFHDCAHGSFLPNRRANLWVGRFTGLLVFQPFANWRHNHAVHHGSSGDLDRRGTGDVPTLTVDEYLARPWKARLGYRLFRNPVVMFGIGPIWSLMIGPRLRTSDKRTRLRRSVALTNVAIATVVGAQVLVFGWAAWAVVEMIPAFLAAVVGVWLFYVQHQFEDVYWESGSKWSYADAALQGSSYLRLPGLLQFFTGNIGLHHVHHLSAKIPNYNLQRAHDENEVFDNVPVLTLRDGLSCTRLKLIDTEGGRLVTFAEARALQPHAPASTAPAPMSA
jgi:acyl-lipid omega-6 desaturase (Delta-12 desaturase)